VHYQTKVWLNAMVPCPQLPPIEEFGWYMDEKGEVLPVLTTLPPLPLIPLDTKRSSGVCKGQSR
jgi:hypothetical protein